ncbi:bifunctional nuclease family protein [Bacteroides sp. UBA939]|uniref:bifunctional nuclease family protein n=1 Tax=Bacteroides sp. UBA939 TaxID=1946092 RepID=UPI0025C5EC66|nr:bifunctional nuclease family protein [Bacteroides sp. UBA939]
MDKKEKIELKVLDVIKIQKEAGAYAVVLGEADGTRQFSAIVGTTEAQTILTSLKGIIPPQPLTHNLFASCLEILGVKMLRTLIYKVEDGVFYSYIYLKVEETVIRMDARTSDAVAMAMRMEAPIFTYEEILEAEQLKTEAESQKRSIAPMGEDAAPHTDEFLHEDTLDVLQKALQEAIASENYERAVYIRDEIARRRKQQ